MILYFHDSLLSWSYTFMILSFYAPILSWSSTFMILYFHDPILSLFYTFMILYFHDPVLSWSYTLMILCFHDPILSWSYTFMIPYAKNVNNNKIIYKTGLPRKDETSVLLILFLSVSSTRRKLLKTNLTEERSVHTNSESCNIWLGS